MSDVGLAQQELLSPSHRRQYHPPPAHSGTLSQRLGEGRGEGPQDLVNRPASGNGWETKSLLWTVGLWLYPSRESVRLVLRVPVRGASGWVPILSAAEKSMERNRLQVLYSGHVQGVGFRYTVKSLAAGFEVIGTIRNLADGKVELVAEGEKGELSAFQRAIQDSGLGRLIADEKATWSPASGEFRGFTIAG